MKFLAPVGGVINVYGVLSSYKHKGVPVGIVKGLPWAGDNCAFTGFDPAKFTEWLTKMKPYRKTCLFIAVPDVVGDAPATLKRYSEWAPKMKGWKLAYVAQDGSETLEIPESASTLFVGGTTEWKESPKAISVIKRAQKRGMRIHIGRVNWWRRYAMFRRLKGSEDFTCDGTRTRFQGTKKTLAAWKVYESQQPLVFS